MAIRRLLIATTNPAKLAEYRLILRDIGIELELVSLAEVGISETPEETGATFTENALLKARFYFKRARMATLADDGGLEIDALGGEPGVRSHRWLGTGGDDSDQALVAEVIRRMKGVEAARRTARLRATIALTDEEGGWRARRPAPLGIRERTAEAAIEGVIAERAYPVIRAGFPYRAVLVIPERNRYLGELGDEEEAQISQRRIAILKLRDELERIAAGRAAG
ncbi:MAG: non-canonical purine NTP pyrophosphatase [Candidatus Binatus sp.]|jgi:XTP/dITP diphosphohydrolase|uniref:non-canonical purine NTP pyrophosphatase n=1 Tax=Candidatus Binatus sp. TaxID=2811406 RepID=UPI003C715B18